ncbi:MAG: LLM class flavin-dependent oxidoreductase [Candidatus Caldarchaeum sp.]|uniref:LLM class flavin-dependent oxidoreductase n=1 Tax=Caldiarchaeum subterraneum TaxID=311458 RepID=A0A7J3VT57_CALS0
MPRFSVVLEGDKTYETYLAIANTVDEAGFYSLQLYEHLPHKPAWGIALSLAPHVRKIKLGPVTVPANLYSPVANARLLAYLNSISPGALLGISRGAYMAGGRTSVGEVVLAVQKTVEEVRRAGWSKLADPIIYVGTSGPVLTRRAAAMPEVKGVVVDNLANPVYASEMRRVIDESGGSGKELVARPFTFISERQEEVDRFVEELRRYVVDLVDGSPMLRAAGLEPRDLDEADDEARARMLESFAVCGSVEEVLEKCVALLRSGVSHLCFGHPISPNPVDGVRMIAKKVLPSLAELFND